MKGPFDVLIVGAGPAGTTTAALLALRGHRVCVLERQEFPRFQIGESLLPACLPVLERLGIPPTEDTFIYKRGAVFVCEETNRTGSFPFDDALTGCPNHAWHVDRARFDLRLRDRARELGCEVRHGVTVEQAGIGDDGVTLQTSDGNYAARYLVDASGQGRFLARRMEGVQHLERFGATSVYTHFEGLGDAAREELGPDNDIRIMMRPDGWGWIIPLPERRLSVGIVSRGKATHRTLDEGLLAGPMMTRLARGARRLDTRIVGNFSYENTVPTGARFAAVGDATCFLDPVFSSGVTLALRGAESLVEVLSPALAAGTEGAPDLLAEHRASMDRATRTFAALIERFYHTRFADTMFLGEAPDFDMRLGIMSVLAGDVWRTDNPFQEMLLSARRPKARSKGVPSG